MCCPLADMRDPAGPVRGGGGIGGGGCPWAAAVDRGECSTSQRPGAPAVWQSAWLAGWLAGLGRKGPKRNILRQKKYFQLEKSIFSRKSQKKYFFTTEIFFREKSISREKRCSARKSWKNFLTANFAGRLRAAQPGAAGPGRAAPGRPAPARAEKQRERSHLGPGTAAGRRRGMAPRHSPNPLRIPNQTGPGKEILRLRSQNGGLKSVRFPGKTAAGGGETLQRGRGDA